MAAREARIEVDGLLKEALCESVVARGALAEMSQAALVGGPGVEAPGDLRIARCRSASAIAGAIAIVTASVISSCTANRSASSRS